MHSVAVQNVGMRTAADRLKETREKAGYEGATEAAEAFGWKVPTYLSHENGSRNFRLDTARRYARAFRVDPLWLLTGNATTKGMMAVPVVGYVGAGAEVIAFDDQAMGAGLDETEAPAVMGEDAIAVIVRGASMYPAYNDGDMIFYDRIQEDPSACLGREAVVRLEDGRTFIKYLTQGSAPGFFTLLSYNAPPMTDIPVQWAARVHWVRRR